MSLVVQRRKQTGGVWNAAGLVGRITRRDTKREPPENVGHSVLSVEHEFSSAKTYTTGKSTPSRTSFACTPDYVHGHETEDKEEENSAIDTEEERIKTYTPGSTLSER